MIGSESTAIIQNTYVYNVSAPNGRGGFIYIYNVDTTIIL